MGSKIVGFSILIMGTVMITCMEKPITIRHPEGKKHNYFLRIAKTASYFYKTNDASLEANHKLTNTNFLPKACFSIISILVEKLYV